MKRPEPSAPRAEPDATVDRCEHCAALRARVEELLEERDAALERVEQERARAELFLRFAPQLPADRASAGPPPPLRYRLADFAHETLQRAPAVHATAKRIALLLERLRRRRREAGRPR